MRRQTIKAITEELIISNVSKHMGVSQMIQVFDGLFRSLYWSYSELFSKLQELEEKVSSDDRDDWLFGAPHNEPANTALAISSSILAVISLDSLDDRRRSVIKFDQNGVSPLAESSKTSHTKEQIATSSKTTDVRIEPPKQPFYQMQVSTRSFNDGVLVHLRNMSQEALNRVAKSALKEALSKRNIVKGVRSVSRVVIMPDGHMTMCLHSETFLTQLQLEFFEEDNVFRSLFKRNLLTWPAFIESAAMDSGPFKVTILGMEPEEMVLAETNQKKDVIHQLIRLNDKAFEPSNGSEDILDIYWEPISRNPERPSSPVLLLKSRDVANHILCNGLLWRQNTYESEMFGAEKLLARCTRCLTYGHLTTQCQNGCRCVRCGLDDHVQQCTNMTEACAVFLGPHVTDSDECFSKQAVQQEIQ